MSMYSSPWSQMRDIWDPRLIFALRPARSHETPRIRLFSLLRDGIGVGVLCNKVCSVGIDGEDDSILVAILSAIFACKMLTNSYSGSKYYATDPYKRAKTLSEIKESTLTTPGDDKESESGVDSSQKSRLLRSRLLPSLARGLRPNNRHS